MAVSRYYSSSAVETTLSAPISDSATTITVGSVAGFPISYPYVVSLDADNGSKELVDVTNASGTTLTVTRGIDGTAHVSHSLGARVSHDHSGRDFRESREHEAATAAHGVAGDVVGTTDTQVLTHKDLTAGSNTFPSSLATDAEVTSAVSAAIATEVTNRNTAIGVETSARVAADAGKANVSHTHAESDVTNLVSDLAAKAPVSTTATLTTAQALTHKDLTDATNTFPASLATDAEVTAAIAADPGWVSINPNFTSGWTVNGPFRYKHHGGHCYTISGEFERIGTTVTPSASGNITDEAICTLPAPFVFTDNGIYPSVTIVRRSAPGNDQTSAWDCVLKPTGVLTLISGTPGASILNLDDMTIHCTVGL